jgi:hypothetical protein
MHYDVEAATLDLARAIRASPELAGPPITKVLVRRDIRVLVGNLYARIRLPRAIVLYHKIRASGIEVVYPPKILPCLLITISADGHVMLFGANKMGRTYYLASGVPTEIAYLALPQPFTKILDYLERLKREYEDAGQAPSWPEDGPDSL